MTLVSAIYNYGPSTKIGGRGFDIIFYLPTLVNISKLGFPLVLYTSPQNIETTYNLLEKYFINGLKVVGYELESFKHFDKFISWKEKNYNFTTSFNNRNEILCYSKAYWVKNAIEQNYFNTEVFAWIDSGLTHHGIFPEAEGGVELMTKPLESFYYPHNSKNIFTPTLGKKIANRMKSDKMFFCATPWQGGKEIYESFIIKHFNKPIEEILLEKHLVGGLFGSKNETFINFYEKYDNFLTKIINDEIYCLEEQIFSAMNVVFPQLFNYEEFGTWHFYSPGERCSYLNTEGDSFYKIFKRL